MYSVSYMYHTPYINTLDSYFGYKGFSVVDWVRQNLQRDIAIFMNNPFFDLPVTQVWRPIDPEQYRQNKYDEPGATKMIVDFITLVPSARKTDFSANIVSMAEKCNNLIYSFNEEVRKEILVKTLEYLKQEEKIIPILEYLGEISKFYKLNYNIPDTPTLYFSRYSEGDKKGQLKEQQDDLFKEYLRNFQHITTRHIVPSSNNHIETCFSKVLENIIQLVKTNFIECSAELVENNNDNSIMNKIVEESVVNTTEEKPIEYTGPRCEHCKDLYSDPEEEVDFFCDYCNPDFLKDIINPSEEHKHTKESNLEDQYSLIDNSLYNCVVSNIPEFKRFQLIFLDKNNMAVPNDLFNSINKLYSQCGIDHQFKYINNPDNIINKDTIEKFKTLFNREFYDDNLTISTLVEDLKQFHSIMALEKKYSKTIIEVTKKKEFEPKPLYMGCRTCAAVCYCKDRNNLLNPIDDLLINYRNINKKENDLGSSVQPISEFNMGSWINEADSVLETRDNYGYLAEQWKADLADKNSYRSVHIFYILSSNQTIVCTNLLGDIVEFIKKYLSDFEQISYLDTMGQNVIEKIEEFFHIKEFDSLEEAKEKYISFSNLYNLSNNTKGSHDEKNMILGYIKTNYNLSKDPAKRMKASVIQKEIESALREFIPRDYPEMSINVNSKDSKDFAKRISSYLLELDLNKKRFSDGIYYYGIEPKRHDESYEEKLASHKVLPLPPLQPVKYN